jgi:hypothetical protein
MALLLLWGSLVATVIYVEPGLIRDFVLPGSYFPFFVLLDLALWFTMRNFWIAATIVLAIILSTLHLMHWGLALVILLTLVMESVYIYGRHEKIHSTNEQKDRSTGL